jgi:hypothetical protein
MSDDTVGAAQPGYPVAFDVEGQLSDRNRLTTGFRIILAVPHLLLAGGPGIGLGLGWSSLAGGPGIGLGLGWSLAAGAFWAQQPE